MAKTDASNSSDANDTSMSLRLRQDLQFTQRQQGFSGVWVVKDPVSFSHFLFSEREYFLAMLFDGKRSIGEVLTAWQNKFHSRSLTIHQVKSFAIRLVNDNLAVVENLGYGRSLFEANNRSSSRKYAWLANPLAIRFRGINPTAILKEFDWFGRIAFHPAVIVMAMFLAALVLLFLVGNFESVAQRVPAIEMILSTQGILMLVLTMAVVKILHELGHALACRRYGGECFEIGVMLLALIPTLYCNVSDAWMIKDRWKRMMVSFAGIYVEICLAAIAAVFWFLTPPGLLNAMLFNLVLLCSVNTILVNGNPLLRYDGYYLLSDWIEKPNLSTAANTQLTRATSGLFWQTDQSEAFSGGLFLYAVFSFLYRWIVMGVILWGIVTFASRWGAREIGMGISGLLLMAMFFGQAKRMVQTGVAKTGAAQSQSRTGGNSKLSLARSMFSLIVAAALLVFICFIPLPHSVFGEFEVSLAASSPIFAPSDGRIVSIAEPYQQVSAGDHVVRLENLSLQQKTIQHRLELERAKNELKQLESRNQISEQLGGNASADDASTLASKIEVAKKTVAALSERLDAFEEEAARLTVVALSDGIVIPAADRVVLVNGELDSAPEFWLGSLNDSSNRDCLVKSSEHLLTIGDPAKKKITMLVDEQDIAFVESGCSVRLRFDRIRDKAFTGIVGEIFETTIDEPDQAGDSNTQAPIKQFRVMVELKDVPVEAVSGSLGRAKISTASQTIATRVARLFKRAMNTRL